MICNVIILSVVYLLYSYYGFHSMRKYFYQCHLNQVPPFNNNIFKMTFACFLAGLFTTFCWMLGLFGCLVYFSVCASS